MELDLAKESIEAFLYNWLLRSWWKNSIIWTREGGEMNIPFNGHFEEVQVKADWIISDNNIDLKIDSGTY